jgi:hypothetical protein
MISVSYLLDHSGLPGPRGNLSLLYEFASTADEAAVQECLGFLRDDLSNSPEEFVVMCAIVGYCVLHKKALPATIGAVRPHAVHSSWRIREAVAMGIQELAEQHVDEVIDALEPWIAGCPLEQRAVVAALCEPKLLKVPRQVQGVLEVLGRITNEFLLIEGKLTDAQVSLRQTLGYGWSVAMAALPSAGKLAFEALPFGHRHIGWVVRENLKKNRLKLMDNLWVDAMLRQASETDQSSPRQSEHPEFSKSPDA